MSETITPPAPDDGDVSPGDVTSAPDDQDSDTSETSWKTILIFIALPLVFVLGADEDSSVGRLALQVGLPILLLTWFGTLAARWLAQGDGRGRAIRWWQENVENYGGGFYGVVPR